MRNNAATALITKLELLLGGAEDEFLAFQIPGFPVGFGSPGFGEGDENAAPPEALDTVASFSSLVNLVPAASKRLSSDGRMLWSVYETVLTRAAVASEGSTRDERSALREAGAVLDRSKWGAYRRYRAAYLAAERRYRNAELSAEAAGDPELRDALTSRLPRLEAQKDRSLAAWSLGGHKAEVEAALATVERICGRHPRLAWRRWQQDYSRALKTDTRGRTFYDTYPWPADPFAVDAGELWTELRMDGGEIRALNAAATDATLELVSGLESDPAPSADAQLLDLVASNLSVELARIEVVRPWLEPLVFASRAWRWRDGTGPLSDGLRPPSGSLPAYVTAIVLARNPRIEVEHSQNREVVQELRAGSLAFVGPFSVTGASPATTSRSTVVLDSSALSPLSMSQVGPTLPSLDGTASTRPRPAIDPTSMAILLATAAATMPGRQNDAATNPGPEGAQLIAFVCRKLPRSPNPDPKLF